MSPAKRVAPPQRSFHFRFTTGEERKRIDSEARLLRDAVPGVVSPFTHSRLSRSALTASEWLQYQRIPVKVQESVGAVRQISLWPKPLTKSRPDGKKLCVPQRPDQTDVQAPHSAFRGPLVQTDIAGMRREICFVEPMLNMSVAGGEGM
ncbi:hypothetical protein DPEC_G00345410 [Dallia pectoralis]|uniref:Uncharacterized protein n=1 Tax=Dallia pectoralis TaxID=75939 RepID=A0ACC2F3M9_DALPE|nr:hypothetical protein DPEC_G00345410 [Dallia pectoralis]